MPVVIIVVGDTEFHAVFAKPSRLTCLASVMRAIIMPIVVIIVRDTVYVTFGTKPPRQALFLSILKSASVPKLR